MKGQPGNVRRVTTERRIDYIDVDALPSAPRNPKGHDDREIVRSISRLGYIEPAVLDERTGLLVGGHGRRDALQAMRADGADPPDGVLVAPDGRWLAPVVRGWSSSDEREAEAALVALNRIGERGGWRMTELASLLDDLTATPGGLAGTGYTAPDLEHMLTTMRPIAVPEFQPVSGSEQPRLDRRNTVTCPACGHEFVP